MRTIRQFILGRLNEGKDAMSIWRETQDHFRHCGWGYVLKLKREWVGKPPSPPPPAPGNQICSICGETKPLRAFEFRKERSKRRGQCKICRNKHPGRKAARMRGASRRRQAPVGKFKNAAHQAVQRALASGRLVRQPCERCGAVPAHAHHDDHSKPLDVRWLCPPHHREHHAGIL